VSLHTSVLVRGLEDMGQKRGREGEERHLTLVQTPGYFKEDVGTTSGFVGQSAEVVIALCHGSERTQKLPTVLSFSCTDWYIGGAENSVWTKDVDGANTPVTLHIVIGDSKLAILLVCADDELMEDYVYTERRNLPHPDVLTCNSKAISTYTVEIYKFLLVNILDSQMDVDFYRVNMANVQADYKRTGNTLLPALRSTLHVDDPLRQDDVCPALQNF
jgi:hypothetical protein